MRLHATVITDKNTKTQGGHSFLTVDIAIDNTQTYSLHVDEHGAITLADKRAPRNINSILYTNQKRKQTAEHPWRGKQKTT